MYKALICLLVFNFACSKYYQPTKTSSSHYSTTNTVSNSKSDKLILSYKFKVDSATNKIIAKSNDVLTKENYPSTLGNFCCDALNYITKQKCNISPDVVILNKGGLRINLPKGDIKVITLFELMPFENELVVCKVKGENLLKALPILIDKKAPYYGMQIEERSNTTYNCTINNVSVNPDKFYLIATSDYLATGGDNFLLFKNAEVTNCNIKIRDAFIDYCNYITFQNTTIKPYTDERFKSIK